LELREERSCLTVMQESAEGIVGGGFTEGPNGSPYGDQMRGAVIP